MTRIAILGGGLAGLAAAVALAETGCKVELVEARPLLGGRATSFVDAETQDPVDNCQHVAMGCCTNLADFCQRVGIADLVREEPVLYFQDEKGRISPMGASSLPPPFHLAPSFLRARFLSFSDKLRIAYGMWRLLRQPTVSPEISFGAWLDQNGQNQSTKDRYWGLVLTSALNDSLENIAYVYARQVFLEGFLASAKAGVVQLPQVPLADFYGRRLEAWLRAHAVDIQTNTAATELLVEGNRITGSRLKSGALVTADDYILAVPYHRVSDLLPAKVIEKDATLKHLDRWTHSPITSVHFWFDREVMELPHLVPVGRTVQWLFRRDDPASREVDGQYVQAVISAARMFQNLRREQIYSTVLEDVHAILPRSQQATVRHYRVVTEKAATYAMTPDLDRHRPGQSTILDNLWLAGDYTQTGWPATMEGAVRSGYLAAEKILKRHGTPQPFLQGPLPVGRIVRWLAR
jgi:zeta-carotene desaturase